MTPVAAFTIPLLLAALAVAGLGLLALGAMLLRTHARLRASRAELLGSEHRLLLALDGAGHGVWDWDGRAGKVFYSRRWKEMLGYREDEIADDPEEWTSRLHPEDRPTALRRTGQHGKGVMPLYSSIYRLRAKDGSWRWILGQGVALDRDAQGRALRTIGTHTDITQWREAELAQKTTQQELWLAAQVVRDAAYGIISTGLDGKITDVNPAAEGLLGWSAAELVGEQLPALCLVETELEARATELADSLGRPIKADFDVFSAAALRFGRDTHEWTLRRRDGRLLPVLVSITALRDEQDQPIGFVANLADVSKQRESADALRSERNRVQHYLDSVHALILSLDASGRVTLVNRFACRLLGFEEQELIGQNWFTTCLPVGETANLARTAFTKVMQGNEGEVQYVEGQVRCASGEHRLIGWHNSSMRDEDGQLSGILVAGNDITERRALEEARAKAVAEASRLAELKSAFLANMSHEIRTPLHALLGLARMGQQSEPRRPHTELCARVEEAGQHLLGVINDVLDLSKLEAGKLRIDPTAFRLSDQVSQAAALVQPQAQAKHLALAVNLSPDLPDWVYGDALRLGQILINLLGNAVKFTEQGHVVLDVAPEGDQICFSVRDTGVGIGAENLERLFSPFEQADISSARRYGGSGLGLAISRNLAQMMGGDIRAHSRPGVGSRFDLSLPLPERSAAAPAVAGLKEAPAAPLRRLDGLNLLVVDDVEVNRMIVEDMLMQAGASALSVASGQAAIDAVAASTATFDAVLMDIQMPGMDGYEATGGIHALQPQLPVIGLTAYAQESEHERALAVGMCSRLTKPLAAGVLVDELLRLLEGQSEPHTQPGRGESEPAPVPALDSHSRRDRDAEQDGESIIDWAALEARFVDSPGFIDPLLETALRSIGDAPDALRALAAEGDLEGFYQRAHAVKGLAGNLHAGLVYQVADEVCNLAHRGERSALERGDELSAKLELLLAAIECRSQSEGAAPSSPG